jgi:PIN domain nuclease of toxin-antitoxin system
VNLSVHPAPSIQRLSERSESEHLGESFSADPADRLIAATARVHSLTLITSDRGIRRSRAVRTIW